METAFPLALSSRWPDNAARLPRVRGGRRGGKKSRTSNSERTERTCSPRGIINGSEGGG